MTQGSAHIDRACLTIGVTGHRKLKNIALLRTTIRKILDHILEMHSTSHNPKPKLCVLTPLAEGADRLVAEEALKREEDAVLRVILPLTRSDYVQDFPTQESRDEFNRFMEKASSIVELRKRPLENEYPPERLKEGRIKAYVEAGKFVVNHCDVLIALWDGKVARGKGGTAHTVAYAKQKNRPIYIINTLDPSEVTFYKGEENAQHPSQ